MKGLALLLLPLLLAVTSETIVVVDMSCPITEGAVSLLEDAVHLAEQIGTRKVVILLNTNGGTLGATEKIVDIMRRSGISFAVYVPPGGRAFSAGSIVLLASKVAGMGSGSVVGAAQPRPYDEKVANAVAGWASSLAESSGRNQTAAKKFVYENLVLSADEALSYHIAEVKADSLDQFLERIGWSGSLVYLNPGPKTSLLLLITSPENAWFLFMVGVILILVGLAHPTYIMEGIGSVLVLLGFLGMNLIGADLAAIMVIAIGSATMFLELKTGHGILAVLGAIISSLGLILIYQSTPFLSMSVWSGTLIFLLVLSSGFAGFYLYKIRKALKARPLHSLEGLIGREGVVKRRIPAGGEGVVLVESELWTATSEEELEEGERVIVLDVRGLKLVVGRHKK
ncbi:MAG: NfeD family protein [Candidatus Methanodesulfokora sp.]